MAQGGRRSGGSAAGRAKRRAPRSRNRSQRQRSDGARAGGGGNGARAHRGPWPPTPPARGTLASPLSLRPGGRPRAQARGGRCPSRRPRARRSSAAHDGLASAACTARTQRCHYAEPAGRRVIPWRRHGSSVAPAPVAVPVGARAWFEIYLRMAPAGRNRPDAAARRSSIPVPAGLFSFAALLLACHRRCRRRSVAPAYSMASAPPSSRTRPPG